MRYNNIPDIRDYDLISKGKIAINKPKTPFEKTHCQMSSLLNNKLKIKKRYVNNYTNNNVLPQITLEDFHST